MTRLSIAGLILIEMKMFMAGSTRLRYFAASTQGKHGLTRLKHFTAQLLRLPLPGLVLEKCSVCPYQLSAFLAGPVLEHYLPNNIVISSHRGPSSSTNSNNL